MALILLLVLLCVLHGIGVTVRERDFISSKWFYLLVLRLTSYDRLYYGSSASKQY